MSDEKSERGSRRSRRRFFRPKKESSAQAPAPEPNRPAEAKQGATRQRKARRKARSRQRPAEDPKSQAAAEAEVAYVAPQAVFIYTHSAHPEMRDSYEFRPDHFSTVGRRLDDYQIDISSLFSAEDTGPDELPVMKSLSKPDFNWSDWEEEE
ncbi:MAG: hypothetical protein IAE81_06690 [Caldilineaceae bacterium]|jgi:hypothetical protein|nr:hypothetical protein [Caldilineaceae bacterium]